MRASVIFNCNSRLFFAFRNLGNRKLASEKETTGLQSQLIDGSNGPLGEQTRSFFTRAAKLAPDSGYMETTRTVRALHHERAHGLKNRDDDSSLQIGKDK